MEEEEKAFVQKTNEYPTLLNEGPLVEVFFSPSPKGLFQQTEDSYPIFTHLENLIEVLNEPLPSGIFTIDTKSDYPYPVLNHLENLIPVLKPPLPLGIFLVDSNYPYFSHLEPIVPVLTKPLPLGIFRIEDTDPAPKFPHLEPVLPVLTRPYPAGIFISNEEPYPFMTGINELVPLGICYFASNLEDLTIGADVKEITDTSFDMTNVREATIPKDCVFYRNSFPEDCQIIVESGGS